MARGFNGSSDKITFAYNSKFDFGTDAFSISCWVYPTDFDGEETIVRRDSGGASPRQLFLFRLNQTTGTMQFEFGSVVSWPDNFNQVTGDTGFTTDVWEHAGAMRDRTNDQGKVYKGGVLDCTPQTDKDASIDVVDDLIYGVWVSGGVDQSGWFSGYIAEVGIWHRELSTTEWAALGKGYSPLFFPKSLIHYTPLIGRHSPEIDLMTGLNGTLDGTSAIAHPRIFYPTAQSYRMGAVGAPPAGTRRYYSPGIWRTV